MPYESERIDRSNGASVTAPSTFAIIEGDTEMSPTRRDLIRGALALAAGATLGSVSDVTAAPTTINPDFLAGTSAVARAVDTTPYPLEAPFWSPYEHELAARLDRVKSDQEPSDYLLYDERDGFQMHGTNAAGLSYGVMAHTSLSYKPDTDHARTLILDGRISDEAFDAILGMFLAAVETYRVPLPAEHEPDGAAD